MRCCGVLEERGVTAAEDAFAFAVWEVTRDEGTERVRSTVMEPSCTGSGGGIPLPREDSGIPGVPCFPLVGEEEAGVGRGREACGSDEPLVRRPTGSFRPLGREAYTECAPQASDSRVSFIRRYDM